jgi:hypothetical protein
VSQFDKDLKVGDIVRVTFLHSLYKGYYRVENIGRRFYEPHDEIPVGKQVGDELESLVEIREIMTESFRMLGSSYTAHHSALKLQKITRQWVAEYRDRQIQKLLKDWNSLEELL